MIGLLPKSLKINGEDKTIRYDVKTIFIIIEAINDVELKEIEKLRIILECLYVDPIEYNNKELIKQYIDNAIYFINGGKKYDNSFKQKKIFDWEQDEQMIFSALNKVAGRELRKDLESLHWWTFLGYFSEISDSLFTTVISIRQKRNKGKKLEKHEQEFYRNNKDLIDLKQKYTELEQNEIDRLNNLLK